MPTDRPLTQEGSGRSTTNHPTTHPTLGVIHTTQGVPMDTAKPPTRFISLLFVCRRGHEHRLCLPSTHPGLPPQLQCSAPAGTAHGGSGCPLPPDLDERIRQALRDSMQEWLRLGNVVIRDN